MSLQLWIPFFIANLAISLSPGMGALAVVNAGLNQNVRAAWGVVLGLQLALVLQLSIVALGTGWLQTHTEAFLLLRWGGAAYLAWLGLLQLRDAIRPPPLVTDDAPRPPSYENPIWRGFWVNLSNPKALLFMAALVPQFIRPENPLLPQYLIIGLTTLSIDTLVMGSYGMLASGLRPWLEGPRASRWRNGIFGSLFLALSLGLFFMDSQVTP